MRGNITMTSRERIIAALNHQQTDRCPIDLGSNGQTGMNVSTLYRFRKELGLDEHRLKVVTTLSNKVFVLNFGELLTEGSPEEVQSNPKVIEAYMGEDEEEE